MEGLWISTEETSANFLSGTKKTVLWIEQANNGELTARGFFLWNGGYQREWELVGIKYDESSHSISIIDSDNDTLKSTLDNKRKMLIGAVHLSKSEDDTPIDSLNFIPADKNLEIKLLYLRIPDANGEIKYSYKKPEQLTDGLQSASIYNENIDSEAILKLVTEIIHQKYGRMESLLILKDNKLIVDEYFYGYKRTDLHKIY